MPDQVGSYSVKEVLVYIDGQPVSGFAKGTKVTVKRTTKSKKLEKGTDSEAAVVTSSDDSGTITLALLQTSASNLRLTQMLQADELSHGHPHVFQVSVQDLSGRSLHESEEAVIEGWPDSPYAEDMENREWVLLCARLRNTLGGNH
jgi:hypothetical protein